MAFGKVSDRIHSIKIIINKRGIKILLYFSIPFFTPAIIIHAVKNINTNCQIIGLHVPLVNSPNMASSAFGSLPANAPVTDL